ncbi:hypothetical protein [Oceanicella actignis]|uniref:hypothetical protein n=1 Tax=Oceanicella actignis TaxID=1189325 RepID=UPI000F740FF4|nr:hypothetical protein [Oceanicella actignis]
MNVAHLVAEAEARGAMFSIRGDRVHVSASKPLPVKLFEALKRRRDDVMEIVAAMPLLDAEGLPCAACIACGGRLFWKAGSLPPEGPGWHCFRCHPPKPGSWHHACSVPVTDEDELRRDLFEERAAILEHDGGLSRARAEALALEDTARILGLSLDAGRRLIDGV